MAEIKDSTRSKAHERTIVLDEATRRRRQKKALDALEKDNFQDDHPSSTIYVSDFRLQLNKKFQQRFTVDDSSLNEPSLKETVSNSNQISSGLGESGAAETGTIRRKKLKADSKLRIRKNFATLLDEEHSISADKEYNYFTIDASPSHLPQRKFCAVCGFSSNYTCIQCGARYCSVKCLQTHKETRCLKWTA